jgi:transposase, IS30 family
VRWGCRPAAGDCGSSTHDDRIAVADGLRCGRRKKQIAAEIGKSFQTVFREIRRNSKPDGTYQPWWAHQTLRRRPRPKPVKLQACADLRGVVRGKLERRWSPQQVSRFLARSYRADASMNACAETIYRVLFAGLLGRKTGKLRTGPCRRKPHRHGIDVPNKIKNMI